MTDPLALLRQRIGRVPATASGAKSHPIQPQAHALFASTSPHLQRLTGFDGSLGCSAFAVYARLASSPRLTPELVRRLADDRDALLNWYVANYGVRLRPHRTPLAAADIAYLLSDDPVLTLTFSVPRIVAWQALMPFSGAPSLQGAESDAETALAYWWACERAPELGVEDCLVPDAYMRVLKGAPATASRPTVFEALLAAREPALAALLTAETPDRDAIDSFLILTAIERPGLLRFLPPSASRERAQSPLNSLVDSPDDIEKLHDRLDETARRCGFNIATGTYLTRGETGDRAWAVPEPDFAPANPGLLTHTADVQIVGPLHQASGLGRAARLSVATFRRAGVKVLATDFAYGFPSPPETSGNTTPETAGKAGATVFHLNPDMLPLAFAAGPGRYAERRAGYFFWELDAPASCDFLALDLIDTIWTATRFVQGVYAPSFGGPVDCVGLALEPSAPLDRTVLNSALRGKLGVPAGTAIALSVFDGFSYVARKNPVGTIRAFQTAFTGRGDAVLVLKVHNRPRGQKGVQPDDWALVDAAVASDTRIRLLDETVSHPALMDLVAGADVFLSLHRAEGFGLGPAEAMQRGTPVVVTAYGGTEDFCSDETALRVPHTLTAVGPCDYVHAEPGRRWAEPDHAAAVKALRAAIDDPTASRARAATAQQRLAAEFGFEAIGRRYVAALERLLTKP
ncbi:hypothetical protein sos41_15060 [Alphaproteobacteria bacterium SO-S41]|nr:hypothetical protein sos41_15060 [Alphaproteobacteria bacterium SO-S41]